MLHPRPRGRPKGFHDKTEQNTVQSLDRALGILAALSQTQGQSLTELAQATGQSTATVYRALVTFQSHGLTEYDEGTQRWHVGVAAYRIGSAFLRRTKLADRARLPMQQLMQATGETANLGIEDQDQVLFLTQAETHEAIRAFFPPGTRSPMHVSGIGKALLAWSSADRVAKLIARGLQGFTPDSLTCAEDLLKDLRLTRQRGFALDNEERTEGMRCIAAPIFNAYREPVAGLSISGPIFRLPLDRATELGRMVCTAARQVTQATGGVDPDVD